MSDNPEAATPRSTQLRQVADALGVQVENLMDEATSAPWSEMPALLEAFTPITNAQGCRRVLALAQAEAARSHGKAEAAQTVSDGTMS